LYSLAPDRLYAYNPRLFRNAAPPPRMANTVQARKRARQSEKHRQHNAALRSAFRSAIRKVRKAIEAGDKAGATRAFREASSALDRIADKKVIHKNAAGRNKSRLAARIKALA